MLPLGDNEGTINTVNAHLKVVCVSPYLDPAYRLTRCDHLKRMNMVLRELEDIGIANIMM